MSPCLGSALQFCAFSSVKHLTSIHSLSVFPWEGTSKALRGEVTFQTCSTVQHRLKWDQALLTCPLCSPPRAPPRCPFLLLTAPDPDTSPGKTWAVPPPLSQRPCLGHRSHSFPGYHSHVLLDLGDIAILSALDFHLAPPSPLKAWERSFSSLMPLQSSSQFFRMKLKVCSLKSDPSCYGSELGYWGETSCTGLSRIR